MRIHKREGSPYWWYAFTHNGKRYRGSTKAERKADAQAIAAALLADMKAAPQRPESWKLTHVLGTYYTEHGQHLKSHSFVWQKITLFDSLLDTQQPLTSLTTARLIEYRAKRRATVQLPTINRDMAILKAAINHCATAHGIATPAIDWKRLRAPENEHRVRFLSREEFDALIAAADPGMQLAITAAVTTGLRKTAMLGIEWHQVDLRGRTITIPTGKGRKPQVVGIAAPLLKMLKDHRASQTAAGANATPAGKAASESARVVQLRGPVFDQTNFRKRWDKARAEAKLVDFHWHDLRHTFATWARQGGADLLELQKAMAHSSIAVTARYMHIGAEETTTAFDRAASAIGKTASPDADEEKMA